MSGPSTDQIDQVGQADGQQESRQIDGDKSNSYFTKRFSRRFIHYISSNRDADGLTKQTGTGGKPDTFIWDEGWQRIPYDQLPCSVPPRDWFAYTSNTSAFRVREMGFTIDDYQPLVEEIKPLAGSTTLVNNFVNQPKMQVWVDADRVTQNMVYPKQGETFIGMNDEMRNAYPTTFAEGSLVRAVFDVGPEFAASLGQETTTPWGTFNTLNDFNTQTVNTGGGFSQTWKGDPNRWYTMGKVPNMHSDTANSKVPDQYYLQSVQPSGEKIGVTEAVDLTRINQNYRSAPEPIYVRVWPYNGSTGPININAQIVVTYHSVLEFKRFPTAGVLTLNRQAGVAGRSDALAIAPFFAWGRKQNVTQWQTGYNYQSTGKNVWLDSI